MSAAPRIPLGLSSAPAEPLGDAAHAGIARPAPRFHARANPVDQRDLDNNARIVKGLGTLRGDPIDQRMEGVCEPRAGWLYPLVLPLAPFAAR